MESTVNDSINQLKHHTAVMQATIENISSDESNLLSKIEKKKQELDRAEKRLKSLQSVR